MLYHREMLYQCKNVWSQSSGENVFVIFEKNVTIPL